MGLSKDGLERFAAVAASHVGDDKVPGLVALVAQGDEVHVEALGTLAVATIGWDGGLGTSLLAHPARDLAVIVLTQRLFQTPQPPAVHTDLQAAALAAIG